MTKTDDKTKFSQAVEILANTQNITHLEALVQYCEENGVESDIIKKLITPSLKAKLKVDAQALHYLPGGRDSKLPFGD
jgi:hypothetical protein